MPVVVSRSKSGRAKCTCCQRLIPMGDVRYGSKFQVGGGEWGIKYKHLRCVSDKQIVNWHAMFGVNLGVFYAQSAHELGQDAELDEEGKRAFEAVFLDQERRERIAREGPAPSSKVRDEVLHLGSVTSEDELHAGSASAATHEASARAWGADGLFLRSVSELRDMCRQLGVNVSGLKADLVQRVRMASGSEELAAAARAGEGAEGGPKQEGTDGPSEDRGAEEELEAGLTTMNEKWLRALPVAVLRGGLSRRGLPIQGFKGELAKRLLAHQRHVYGDECNAMARTVQAVAPLRLAQVREELKRLGLPTTGRKHALVARLATGIFRENQQARAEGKLPRTFQGQGAPADMHEAGDGGTTVGGTAGASTSAGPLPKPETLDGDTVPAAAEWPPKPRRMRKDELQAELARLGQPVYGLRTELVQRLTQARKDYMEGRLAGLPTVEGPHGMMLHGAASQMTIANPVAGAPRTVVAVPGTPAFLASHQPLSAGDFRHVSDEQLMHILASHGMPFEGPRHELEARLNYVLQVKRTQAVLAQDMLYGGGQGMLKGAPSPPRQHHSHQP